MSSLTRSAGITQPLQLLSLIGQVAVECVSLHSHERQLVFTGGETPSEVDLNVPGVDLHLVVWNRADREERHYGN